MKNLCSSESLSLTEGMLYPVGLNKSDLIHFFSSKLDEVEFTSELKLKLKSVIRWLSVLLDTKLLVQVSYEKEDC